MSIESFLIAAVSAQMPQDVIWPTAVTALVAAIVMGFSKVIVKTVRTHRERIVKIGMGIDPDAPPHDDSTGSAG